MGGVKWGDNKIFTQSIVRNTLKKPIAAASQILVFGFKNAQATRALLGNILTILANITQCKNIFLMKCVVSAKKEE